MRRIIAVRGVSLKWCSCCLCMGMVLGWRIKMAFGGSNIKTERLTIRPSLASGGFCDYTIEVDRLVKKPAIVEG